MVTTTSIRPVIPLAQPVSTVTSSLLSVTEPVEVSVTEPACTELCRSVEVTAALAVIHTSASINTNIVFKCLFIVQSFQC
jgi:hypothetical protein